MGSSTMVGVEVLVVVVVLEVGGIPTKVIKAGVVGGSGVDRDLTLGSQPSGSSIREAIIFQWTTW